MTGPELILAISRSASSGPPVGSFVRETGALIVRHFGVAMVDITVAHRETGQVLQWMSGDRIPDESLNFLLSRDIQVRGATYGRIEVGTSFPLQSKAAAIQILEVVAQQIALFLELGVGESLRSRLSEEIDAVVEDIRLDKILSRAAGIVARTKRLSLQAAVSWLRSESVQAGKPLAALAQEWIEQAVAERYAVKKPWAPLRRIA